MIRGSRRVSRRRSSRRRGSRRGRSRRSLRGRGFRSRRRSSRRRSRRRGRRSRAGGTRTQREMVQVLLGRFNEVKVQPKQDAMSGDKMEETLTYARDNLASTYKQYIVPHLFLNRTETEWIDRLATQDYFIIVNQPHEDLVAPEKVTVEHFVNDVTMEYLEIAHVVVHAFENVEMLLKTYHGWRNIESVSQAFRQSSMDDKIQREKRKTREFECKSKVAQATYMRMKMEMEYRWVKFLAKEFCPESYALGAAELEFLEENELEVIESQSLSFIKNFLLTVDMLVVIKSVEDKRRDRTYYSAHGLVNDHIVKSIERVADGDIGSLDWIQQMFKLSSDNMSEDGLILPEMEKDPVPEEPSPEQAKLIMSHASRHPDLAALCCLRGKLYMDRKHYAVASTWYSLGLNSLENYHRKKHKSIPHTKVILGDAYLKAGEHHACIKSNKEAIMNLEEMATTENFHLRNPAEAAPNIMACYARAHFGIARGLIRSGNNAESEKFMQAAINIYRTLLRHRRSHVDAREFYSEYLQVYNRYAMALLNMQRKADAHKTLWNACKALNQCFNIPDGEMNLFEICTAQGGFQNAMDSAFWRSDEAHDSSSTKDLCRVLRSYFTSTKHEQAAACLDHYFSADRFAKPNFKQLLQMQKRTGKGRGGGKQKKKTK